MKITVVGSIMFGGLVLALFSSMEASNWIAALWIAMFALALALAMVVVLAQHKVIVYQAEVLTNLHAALMAGAQVVRFQVIEGEVTGEVE